MNVGKISRLVTVIFVFSTSVVTAQPSSVRAIGSNFLRLGDGETDNGISIQPKRYLEEIANARIFFEHITLGLRYELSDPSEVGPNFQGFRRRWIEYSKDGLELQAGDVYALYGRGLAVNMFESRSLNYDSWLDGFSASYDKRFSHLLSDLSPSLSVNAIGGNKVFFSIDTLQPPLNISARSVNGQIGILGTKVHLGASFLQAFTSVTESGFGGSERTSSREVNQPEVYLSFLAGSFDGFFGFTEIRSRLSQVRNSPDSTSHRGRAMYGSLSYSGEEFGVTVEYKNYEYFVHAPGVKNEAYLGKLPLSNPPEVYKEFTYTSLTRTTHAVNFNDELGFQIEASITAIPDLTITLNTAASSRHYGFGSELDSNFTPILFGKKSFLPELTDQSHFPFWEAFAEFEYEINGLDYVKVFGHRRSDVIAYSGQSAYVKRSTSIGAKAQIETATSQSALASMEYQKMFDTESTLEDHRPDNLYVLGQYSFAPLVTFGGIFDFSTDYGLVRHIWPQGFLSLRIGGSHTILMSYGAERGGINCSGGICRYVPPFNGFRLAVTSQI